MDNEILQRVIKLKSEANKLNITLNAISVGSSSNNIGVISKLDILPEKILGIDIVNSGFPIKYND